MLDIAFNHFHQKWVRNSIVQNIQPAVPKEVNSLYDQLKKSKADTGRVSLFIKICRYDNEHSAQQPALLDSTIAIAGRAKILAGKLITLIHQKLYQSECLDLIQMPEYIEELIGHLKDSFDLGSRIIFEKQIAELYLDVSQAVPLGLIINEAITNAIKYAYPRELTGVIRISLLKVDGDRNILLIKDNGPGFKKDFDPNKINSLGMNLMKGLSKQLGGSIEMAEDHGILVKIVFKTEVFAATSPAVS